MAAINWANRVTLVRFGLIPLFLLFMSPAAAQWLSLQRETSLYIAAGLFVLAALTDRLDGYIARTYNQVTKLGALLDPLVDKLLIASALLVLVQEGLAASWVVVLILGREFLVTLLRIAALRRGLLLSADRWGKYKLVLQVVAVLLLLLHKPLLAVIPVPIAALALYAAAIMTVASGWNYVARNRHVLVS